MSTQGIDRQAIMSRALRHGFTLRQQPGGEMDLNEYVYAFAREVFEAGRKAERAAPEPHPCETCNGRGEIGGFQGGAAPGYVTEACPDCAGAGHAKQQEAEEAAAPTYSYSNYERFFGAYDSPEEAAADYLNDNPDDEAVDVGKNQQRTAHNYVGEYHVESLLEMVAESAYEECGDCAESWLSKMTADSGQINELKQVVGDWIQRKEPPSFWHVEFIRRITRAELIASGHLVESGSDTADPLIGLRGCNSQHGGSRSDSPCIYRMRTTDPGCTGCVERDEDQSAEAGGCTKGERE